MKPSHARGPSTGKRRQFLRLGARTLTGAGLVLGANPLTSLARTTSVPLSDASDYRALVCVYLAGGCDGFSLMIPTGSARYREYAATRQHLALPEHSLLPLRSDKFPPVALHPSTPELADLFHEGRLALLSNIGNLVEPTDRQSYEAGAVSLPAQLFSHSDQEIQWQQLQGRGRGTSGWGALAAEYLASQQSRDYLTSITLNGSNYWQTGSGQRPFSLTEAGVLQYAGLNASSEWEAPRRRIFKRLLEQQRDHVFTRAYAHTQRRALQITEELGMALDSSSALSTVEPIANELAARLKMVARLIGVREQLGMRRQIFFVQMGGFDVHDNQNKNLPALFAQLSEALAYFQRSLDALEIGPQVTTLTASDLGRSLTSNGDGTDHGWGNHLMVMGDAVRGGEVYGQLPSMNVDGPDSIQHGRVVPTLSATQYAATLLDWMGIPDADLAAMLPTLKNFPQRRLGFMG